MLFCGRKRKHKFHIVQALLAVTLLLLLSFAQNANAKEQENGEEIYETEIGELEQSTEETEDTEDVDNTEENKIAFFSQTYGNGTISLGSYNGGGTISLTEDVTASGICQLNGVLDIDLNGHKMAMQNNASFMLCSDNAVLNIRDSAGGGVIYASCQLRHSKFIWWNIGRGEYDKASTEWWLREFIQKQYGNTGIPHVWWSYT